MGKLLSYITILSGILLLLHITGAIPANATPNSILLGFLLNPSSFLTSSFYAQVYGIFAGIAIGGATVAFIFTQVDLILIAPVIIFLIGFFADITYVYSAVASASPILAMILISPMIILFLLSLIEWWRGRD